MNRKPTYQELEQRIKHLEKECASFRSALEAMEEREARLHHMLNTGPAVIYTCETTGNYAAKYMSKNVRDQLGYEPNEFTEDPNFWADHIHPDDRHCVFDELPRLFEHDLHTHEYRFQDKQGTYKWMRDEVRLVRDKQGKPLEIVGYWIDITERKRAEEALRASEEDLRAFMDSVSDLFAITDKNENLIYVNRSMAETLGYYKEDMIGMHITEIISEESMANFESELKELVETGTLTIGATWLTRSREKVHGELNVNAIYDTDGKYAGSRGVFRDITKRKLVEEALQKAHDELDMRVKDRTTQLVKANEQLKKEIEERRNVEGALRESEERHRAVLEASPDPIVVYDMEGMVVYLNPAFTEVFGWTLKQLMGKKVDYVPEENWPETRIMINKVLVGESLTGIQSRRYTKGRDVLDVSISVATYLDRDGSPSGSVHTLRDITKRKHLEAQLQQAHRLESIGTLAGGIAHDFNNLLMGVQGHVSLMLMGMDASHPNYDRLKNIEEQIQSGARLTSHLLGYAQKGRYEVKPIDLNQLVERTANTFGRTKKDITIHREPVEDLLPVKADPAQIEQVLLNLFVNAADAMPGGGKLLLKTMNVTHKDMTGRLYEPKPGNYVLLTVTDTGTGMYKKTIERIFDPFFTTKEMGRGTGLGLASAYGIIKAHDGYVDVDSKRGQGTTFSIYLPASETDVQIASKLRRRVAEGTNTVLLVDDEEVVLEVGQELLEAAGYRVLTAKEGKAAVKVYRKNRDSIDIVVLDMVMPIMGGGEAFDRMKEINPDIKVLLSSGFSIDGEASEILERGCDGFIQKPFTMKQLSGKIKEILSKE
jgi:PAS domain S-box-containing protein